MPRFSIVIPVYNGKKYLPQCLDSILSQWYKDVEVICVEDCGPDGSWELLQDYAAKDPRVKAFRQPENRGSARARRAGVLASAGEYVLFSDQDDSFAPASLQKIENALRRNPVDILQYGVKVINDGGVSQWDIDGSQKWMEPYKGCLEGRAIVDGCFRDNLFSYSIWNKAYEGDMARRAFERMEDCSIPLGEDNYASFVLAYFARSYGSISDRLYEYHYGRGYTGQLSLSAEAYRRTCGLSVAADLIEGFLKSQGTLDDYRDTCLAARAHMLDYALDIWRGQVPEGERVAALRELLLLWPYQEVAQAMLAKAPWAMECLLEARFGEIDSLSLDEQSQAFAKQWRELRALSDEVDVMRKRIDERRKQLEDSKAFHRGNALVRLIKRR